MIRALKSSGLQVAAVKIEHLVKARVRKDECTGDKERARERLRGSCRVCRVCDGRACAGGAGIRLIIRFFLSEQC